jgi:Uma2 family endonuclease
LRPKNTSIIGPKKLTGVPDLLIEILSPSTRRYDRRQKRNRYERAGVRELWLVDPDTRTVEQFVLRGKVYAAPFIATTRVSLRVLRGITIDLNEVW